MSQYYTIQPVQRDDTDDIIKLFKRTFYIDEPLSQGVALRCGTERGTELDEYDYFLQKAMHEGLSYKAADGDGNIVGVTISGVCPLKEDDNGNDLLSQAERCENKKYQKILYILAKRESGARLWEKFPEDESCVAVKVAATDPAWRRKGIMNQLVAETEKAMIARGLRIFRLNTTSAYAAKSAERLGFTCFYKALYAELLLDGQPLIVPEPPHVDTRVYIKTLFENN